MLNPKDLKPGHEQFEKFEVYPGRHAKKPKHLLQYDYRALDGELFSVVKATLEMCVKLRDEWLEKKKKWDDLEALRLGDDPMGSWYGTNK